jgi:hypothetical protein
VVDPLRSLLHASHLLAPEDLASTVAPTPGRWAPRSGISIEVATGCWSPLSNILAPPRRAPCVCPALQEVEGTLLPHLADSTHAFSYGCCC